jgi:hypothetical protein
MPAELISGIGDPLPVAVSGKVGLQLSAQAEIH